MLVARSTAFKLDKFDDKDLDALFADLPPAGTKETSSGSGYSTTSFKEIGFAQTSCESSSDSAMFEEYVEAYVEAGARMHAYSHCPDCCPARPSMRAGRHRPVSVDKRRPPPLPTLAAVAMPTPRHEQAAEVVTMSY